MGSSVGTAGATNNDDYATNRLDLLFFRDVDSLSLRFLLGRSCFASFANQQQPQGHAKYNILNLLALQLEHGTPLSQRILRVRQLSH